VCWGRGAEHAAVSVSRPLPPSPNPHFPEAPEPGGEPIDDGVRCEMLPSLVSIYRKTRRRRKKLGAVGVLLPAACVRASRRAGGRRTVTGHVLTSRTGHGRRREKGTPALRLCETGSSRWRPNRNVRPFVSLDHKVEVVGWAISANWTEIWSWLVITCNNKWPKSCFPFVFYPSNGPTTPTMFGVRFFSGFS